MAKLSTHSGGATILDDARGDFYRPVANQEVEPRPARPPRPEGADDAEQEPFLRARRRVPVRKGILPAWAKTRWGRVVLVVGGLMVIGAGATVVILTRSFLDHDPRFRIESAASIQTMGNTELSRGDLLSVFGADIGHNLFVVPVAQRRAELERFPWVERATVMRVLPNQLRVAVKERTPIAFVQVKGRIELADIGGVILDMPPREMAAKHYSFPVVSGINPGDPLSVRSARMQIYQRFIHDLDSGTEKVSPQLSEIDLSDPADVKATVPSAGTDLVLQFGQDNFLARWANYEAHIAQWRQQYPNLAGVDLRYEHEVVLKLNQTAQANPAAPSAPTGTAANPAAAATPRKAAAAAPKAAHPAVAKKAAVHRAHSQAAKHAGRGAR
ncbi:MAG TPA: FtsQ-type POTRA domain-containing protein [Acidobacteriaceae bacterium]|nr:FtsQ-type POTRA domain-containing protein [Acidobacteriaceae bacterium]